MAVARRVNKYPPITQSGGAGTAAFKLVQNGQPFKIENLPVRGIDEMTTILKQKIQERKATPADKMPLILHFVWHGRQPVNLDPISLMRGRFGEQPLLHYEIYSPPESSSAGEVSLDPVALRRAQLAQKLNER